MQEAAAQIWLTHGWVHTAVAACEGGNKCAQGKGKGGKGRLRCATCEVRTVMVQVPPSSPPFQILPPTIALVQAVDEVDEGCASKGDEAGVEAGGDLVAQACAGLSGCMCSRTPAGTLLICKGTHSGALAATEDIR